ncbi:MAG: endonuclease III [Bdellovibrionales bacterium]|nr:endonuclease III [Bdellovibrionales bacterium]
MKKNVRSEMALEAFNRLKKLYPDAHCELNHSSPFELLIATILSAQCTDVRVNMVTPALFKKFPTSQKLAKAKLEDVEELIKSINFYKNKSKSLIGCAQLLGEKFNHEVPRTVDELVELPGVGRKTANVVLGNAFNINTGIVVDTHVKRTTFLLGFTKNDDPEKVEQDLMKLFPNETWTELAHLFIFLGRRNCIARRPQCDLCVLNDICPSVIREKKVPQKSLRGTK